MRVLEPYKRFEDGRGRGHPVVVVRLDPDAATGRRVDWVHIPTLDRTDAAFYAPLAKLEAFLRRRSKISLVVRREEIRRAPGLREACAILFGRDIDAKISEYFDGAQTPGASGP